MLMALVLAAATGLTADAPPDPTLPATDRATAYEGALDRAGRGPDARVDLALWCEANGLSAERVKHLAAAVLADPANARARALLGMVAYGGRWRRPEDVERAARSDEVLQRALAEYNAKREGTPETADAHFVLADWCDRQGLKPEALAHFTAVTRLDPGRADAWLRLGCRRYYGRWMTDAEVAAVAAEADAQKRADAQWVPRLKDWWRALLAEADRARRAEAEAALDEALEPRAVRPIRSLFAAGTPSQQLAAVRLLDRIDSPESSAELARLTGQGRTDEVRRGAAFAVSRRDPNEVVAPLLDQLREPIKVALLAEPSPVSPGLATFEDETTVLRKFYVDRVAPVMFAVGGGRGAGLALAVQCALATPPPASAAQRMGRDLRAAEARNVARVRTNDSVIAALRLVTGDDQGDEPGSWKRWWNAKGGYTYARTPPVTTEPKPKRRITRVSQAFQIQPQLTGGYDCLGAGTPVHTLLGPRPVEELRVGDRLLAEDPKTGALSYQPVVALYQSPSMRALRLTLDGESVVATPVHRFWRPGKGWVMARDLKPGDTVRTLDGLARVGSLAPEPEAPVYNLEVAGAHSFFVGHKGALVHDNSTVLPASAPFDAAPTLAARARRPGGGVR
jgi:hypothetical protein